MKNNHPHKHKCDEIIYPPAESIVSQLATIRSIISPTIKMYEATKSVASIQANLDMIQRAIDYLRGAVAIPDGITQNDFSIIPMFSKNISVTSELNHCGEYDISILGVDVKPDKLDEDELNGKFKVVRMGLVLGTKPGITYLITEKNPSLAMVPNKLSIDEINHEWVKEKSYYVTTNTFMYPINLLGGRTGARITIESPGFDTIILNITSHIYFEGEDGHKPHRPGHGGHHKPNEVQPEEPDNESPDVEPEPDDEEDV